MTLDRVQRWMQSVIVHPGDVEEALGSADASRELPPGTLSELVSPSWSLSPEERVEVYHGMYLLRMVEALAADYPALRYAVGDDAFADLVRAYVGEHPSSSYTLNRLGDHLPRYLDDHPELPNAALLADLARFELAITEAFDEAESPVLQVSDLESIPPDRWDALRLEPIPALRLLSLRHAVVPHLEAYHHDRPRPRPLRRPTRLVVYRRSYKVFHLELSRPEHALLTALVGGKHLAEALAGAVAGIRSARRQKAVFGWFRTWVGAGLFCRAVV
jgi:hypothetical protein